MKLSEESFSEVLRDAESFMLENGIVTMEGHKKLKELLKKAIPGVKELEYLTDDSSLRVEVRAYFGFWKLAFSDAEKMAKNLLEILEACLPEYTISVRILRHNKKVDKSTQ